MATQYNEWVWVVVTERLADGAYRGLLQNEPEVDVGVAPRRRHQLRAAARLRPQAVAGALVPTQPRTACLAPRCPHPASRKGRCRDHSPLNDGCSATWRQTSAAHRRTHPYCQRCGTTEDTTTDHIVPGSLGATDAPSNLRTLCRRCHATIGRARSRPGDSEPVEPSDPPIEAPERDVLRIVG